MKMKRRSRTGMLSSESLSNIIPSPKNEADRWLFIAPHDDDILIGGGLLLQEAVRQGRRIRVLITTDGSMGYCTPEDRDHIVEIRRRETLEAYGNLGITDILWLDFPDANLAAHRGRRPAPPASQQQIDPPGETVGHRMIEGFTGLQNSYTYHLRAYRPSHLFLMSENDYNPDHKVVHQEVLASIFHALGDIWPELGPHMNRIPRLYEMAAYRNFREAPDIELQAREAELQHKLDAVGRFQSQRQIALLVDNLKKNGPYEYLRTCPFDFYSPGSYRDLFEEGDEAGG